MFKAGDEAVIDTDLLNKITQAPNIRDGKELFLRTMRELNVIPVTHYYLAEREMQVCNKIATELIVEGHIKVFQKEDFIPDRETEEEYAGFFRKWYNYLNPEERIGKDIDIFNFKKSGHSMGEIHALLMARYMNLKILMSDDLDAKWLVKNSEMRGIQVYDLVDIYTLIGQREEKTITLSEVENIIRRENPLDSIEQKRRKKKKYIKVKNKWR